MKTYPLEHNGTTQQIQLEVKTYSNNNLAIVMNTIKRGKVKSEKMLTVNFPVSMPANCACIDTNNNSTDILAWIIRHGLAIPTGRTIESGFCNYPEYLFRVSVLEEADSEGYKEYLRCQDKIS